MNKVELINAIDPVIKNLSDVLIAGDKITFIGFGTFSVTERSERTGMNPATKQPITIKAKKVAKFKAGAEMTNAMN